MIVFHVYTGNDESISNFFKLQRVEYSESLREKMKRQLRANCVESGLQFCKQSGWNRGYSTRPWAYYVPGDGCFYYEEVIHYGKINGNNC